MTIDTQQIAETKYGTKLWCEMVKEWEARLSNELAEYSSMLPPPKFRIGESVTDSVTKRIGVVEDQYANPVIRERVYLVRLFYSEPRNHTLGMWINESDLSKPRKPNFDDMDPGDEAE